MPASGAASAGPAATAVTAFTGDDDRFDAEAFTDPDDDEPFDAEAYFTADDGEPFDAEAYFNPFSGPPEGDDAWLAQVASPVADEYLDSLKPPAGPREMLAAGFTHGDHEAGARGWAAGGALDIMEPGPVLAGFADDAVSDGLAALNDDELIGVICAARRLASRAASIELAAIADLNGRREAYAEASGDRRQAEHVADELAVALTLTCRAADRLLGLATGVTRLPAVTAALAAGQIDLPKAGIYARELAELGDEPAAAIAAITIADAARMTTAELGDVLRRLVLAHDPDAARQQRKKAQKDARVEAWAETRGTAALAGRDLPPADVLAADKRIDATARQLKKAGAAGTLEQLRAKVFIALLTSRPLYTLLPGKDGGRDDNSDGGEGGEGDPGFGDVGGGGTRRHDPGAGPFSGGPGTGAGAAIPPGLAGSVNLTIPLSTWLGLTGQPGEAAGHGPLDADTSRAIADRVAAHPASRWCLTITDSSGRAIGHGCAPARAGPPPPGTGPPGRTRPASSGPPPPGTGPPGRTRPASNTEPAGNPRPDASTRSAGSPQPDGRTRPADDGGPPGPGCARWLAGLKIDWLETRDCGHARETFAYQPSASLRHLIKTRHRTCAFPGCRRPARWCDDDHTIPFDQGGRSCECNLSSLCRRHHGAKQAPGWKLEQPQPGFLRWTLPSQRIRTTTPRPYAA